MSQQEEYQTDSKKYDHQVHRFHHAVVKENGCYLSGVAYDEVIDAVERDNTQCIVDGYTIHILEHTVDENGNKITTVKVEGID